VPSGPGGSIVTRGAQRMFAQAGDAFAAFSPFWGTLYLLHRFLSKATGNRAGLYCYLIHAQPVPQDSLLGSRRGASISVRRLHQGDPAVAGLPGPAAVIDERFRQGSICLGAFRENALIGCLWLQLGGYDEDEVRCRFEPLPGTACAWDYDVHVDPTARHSFAFARLWDEANALLRREGRRWTVSRISAFNPGSLAAHHRLGSVRIGTAAFMRLGGLQFLAGTVPPYVHVSVNSRPVLRIDVAARTGRGKKRRD